MCPSHERQSDRRDGVTSTKAAEVRSGIDLIICASASFSGTTSLQRAKRFALVRPIKGNSHNEQTAPVQASVVEALGLGHLAKVA